MSERASLPRTRALHVIETDPPPSDVRAGSPDIPAAREALQRLIAAGLQSEAVQLALSLARAGGLDCTTLVEAAGSCLQAGDPESAEELARGAVSKDPDDAAARNTLAYCLIQRRAFAAAAEEAAAAVRLEPALAPAHNHLGIALNATGHGEAAVEAFAEALRLAPRDLNYGLNLATTLEALGRLDEALRCIDATRIVFPTSTSVYLIRANILQKLQRYPEALDCYETAIDLAPDSPTAHWKYSLCLLLTGRHAEGWREYEWRLKETHLAPQRPFPMPQWQGEDLRGRSILVHAEQGFGDAIQFARYVPLLRKAGAEVVLEAFAPLVDLFTTLEGRPAVLAAGQPLPPVDFHCPLMSLPLALRADHPVIPAHTPYLSVPPAAAARWASRFDPLDGLLVGLVCSGRPTHGNDANRSMSLEVLAQALPPGPRYFLLQQELREADAKVLLRRPDIICLKDDLRDFSDTAAAVERMDLVISVDTSVAHLAGALARPLLLLLLLPFQPEWRWGLASDTCAWYPTARLVRQSAVGDWSDPMAAVTEAVSALPRDRSS
jgi:tetratricopeptide (TPR) repeat protein